MSESSTPGAKTILVVDDEPHVREYLRMILEDAGFRVLTAGDGQEALEIVRSDRPDFISLDLVMPRMSGHKLLYELRRDPSLSRIPFMIVTAHAGDEMGKQKMDDLLENRIISGPGTYLEKPVNPTTYLRSIKRALGMAEEPTDEDRVGLREQLQQSLRVATPEDLRRALEALQREEKE
jgi:two-component system alkaline phosphatase synthesis response regulator PhoP